MELTIRSAWKPLASQRRLIEGTERVTAYLAGLGAGKTSGGAHAALGLACINAGFRGIIVAPTGPLLHGTTLAEFRAVCPPEIIADENKQQRWIELINGSRIYYWSADGKTKLVGFNVAWFWLDEPADVERKIFEKLLARLREPRATRLRGIVTGTPSMGWVYDEFSEPRQYRELITAPTAENVHLPSAYVDDLRRTYDAALFAQMVEGRFVALSGLVYDGYHPAESLVDQGPSVGLETWVGVDLGYRRPAIVVVQRRVAFGGGGVRPGEWVVVDEEMPEQGSAAEVAEAIRRRGYRITQILVDPSCTVDERMALERAGPVTRAKGEDAQSRHLGVERVRAALRDATGHRSLFFSRALRARETEWRRGVLKDIEAFRWKKQDRAGPQPREPFRDGLHDHGMDALRYVVAYLCPPVADLTESRHTR